MPATPLRRSPALRVLLRLALTSVLLYLARESLRRWVDGPDPRPDDARWSHSAADDAPVAPTTSPSAEVKPKTSVKIKAHPKPRSTRPAAPSDPGTTTPADATGQPPSPAPAEPAPVWVEAGPDGSAPASHPVKVKLSSGIYHVPGGANYARTHPDRCYPSEEAAEADGFTRAKR